MVLGARCSGWGGQEGRGRLIGVLRDNGSWGGVWIVVAVNCHGPTRLLRALTPRLLQRAVGGGVLLLGSVSGERGHALAASYAASKAYVTSLGEGLWAELEPHGVHVRVCVAGATLTPNFCAATPEARRARTMPSSPASVARAALSALKQRGAGPVVVAGLQNRLAVALMNSLPRAWAVRFMSANLRGVYDAVPV